MGTFQGHTAANINMSSGLMRRVVWYKFIDVSEVLAASIIRAIALRMENKSVTYFLHVYDCHASW
jgi:hypothetical protein